MPTLTSGTTDIQLAEGYAIRIGRGYGSARLKAPPGETINLRGGEVKLGPYTDQRTVSITVDSATVAYTTEYAAPDDGWTAGAVQNSLSPGSTTVAPSVDAVNAGLAGVAGAGLADGDKGDITVSGTGTVWTIDAAAVSLAKMANLAQDQFIGRTTASTGVPQTATITAAARTVLDDASVGDMRTTLGLGTAAVAATGDFEAAGAVSTHNGVTTAHGITAAAATVLDDTTVGAMVNTLGGATATGTGGLVREGSPALTGTPTAPTAAAGTNTTQLATTAHVLAERTNTRTLTGATISGASNTLSNLPAAGISGVIPIANLATGTPNGSKFIRDDGTLQAIAGGGDALVANPLSQFAATTSDQLAGVINDETGSGPLVFANSPALTGTPSAPTAAGGTNTTQLATTAFVAAAITALINSAPGALDTLDELAAALGDDASFATTVTNALAAKAPLASATMTALTANGLFTTDGAHVSTVNAMGALAIDVTKGRNTKSISADSTFTFSATPTSGAAFRLDVQNTDTAPHILTFPSSFSQVTQAARTTCPIAASGKLSLVFAYDGTTTWVYGDSPYFHKFDATAAPAVTDDIADGYGPGSLWYDATGNDLYVCESNGAGAAVWTAVAGAGAGDVSKVGTPSNNQMPVWTGDGTLEGTSDLTYDGTSLNLITAKNFQIAGTTILADASGTTTLSGIDAIDATTEATIEAAIDTLANLTSIQGRTVTLADAGADALLGWDDSASAYQNLSAADARTALALVVGTNVQAFSANLDEYAAVNPTAAGLALLDDADAAAQRTTLAAATTAQNCGASMFIRAGENATFVLQGKARFAWTITEVTAKTASGTITVQARINTTNVTGGSVNVTSTEGSSTATAANSVAVGDTVDIVTTSNSSAVDLWVDIGGTRTLA